MNSENGTSMEDEFDALMLKYQGKSTFDKSIQHILKKIGPTLQKLANNEYMLNYWKKNE